MNTWTITRRPLHAIMAQGGTQMLHSMLQTLTQSRLSLRRHDPRLSLRETSIKFDYHHVDLTLNPYGFKVFNLRIQNLSLVLRNKSSL